ncbi:MAG: hypothetical protein SGCHY_005229 [Lobulomycetales sp.]
MAARDKRTEKDKRTEEEEDFLGLLDAFFPEQQNLLPSTAVYRYKGSSALLDHHILISQNTLGCGGQLWPAVDLLCHHLAIQFAPHFLNHPDHLDIQATPKLLKKNHLDIQSTPKLPMNSDHLDIQSTPKLPMNSDPLAKQVAPSSLKNPVKVLELGSGTGIVGIWLQKFLEKLNPDPWVVDITVTDLEIFVPLMKENAALNGIVRDSFHVAALPWGTPYRNDARLASPTLVLLSDCVYNEALFDPLIQTLREVVTGDAICWMSYKKRWKREKRFFIALKKYFFVRVILPPGDAVYEAFRRERLTLYEITAKASY